MVLTEACVSFGGVPKPFDLFHFFSAPMSLTSRCIVTFRALSTYLWRTANQVQIFFHTITTVPAAVAVGVRLRGASSPSAAAAKRPLD